ncbi:hypothetical protein [Chryseobacterium aquifrigidense]|uniref:Lipocalin-like protein n=1 Tax=Chryseobacterium aquifrigidense TaxID=558021 RepID=A0A543E9K5_9FLAO|nr:hypothetical protein [Chryseobacterium aquifrigidense]TQM18284.1 hypothetical protein FB551_4065 [Chryseobacterium aquifrigidense]
MKKIFILWIALCLLTFNSCSSNDNENTETPIVTNKNIPAELIGSWKINHIFEASDPNYDCGNFFGAYVKVKTDNTIEYYDGNKNYDKKHIMPVEQVSGTLLENGTQIIMSAYQGKQQIICKKSSKYTGEVEFKILYPSESPYTNMILSGIKQ